MNNKLVKKDEQFSFSGTSNMAQALKVAEMIAGSDLAPKDYKGKPANVLVAVEMGRDLGLKPMQALQNIAVINGRPCLWGDAMLAVVKSHPEFVSIKETNDGDQAVCIISRRNKHGIDEVTGVFSKEDAKVAKLLEKPGPWSQYPKRMLQMRARGFAIRDAFPDALKGMQIAEEVADINYENNEKTQKMKSDAARSALRIESSKDTPTDSNVIDQSASVVIDVDLVKSEDIQTLESMIIDGKIPPDVIKSCYEKTGVERISELKQKTITYLIGKYAQV